MSPIPSPTPMRRTVLRFVFSPTVLVCSFVLFLIVVCPNARGEDVFGIFAPQAGHPFPGGSDLMSLNVPVAAARPVKTSAIARPTMPSVRSATLEERGPVAPAVEEAEPFRHSRAALPLLVEPLQSVSAKDPFAHLSPMTGPAVGVKAKVPAPRK